MALLSSSMLGSRRWTRFQMPAANSTIAAYPLMMLLRPVLFMPLSAALFVLELGLLWLQSLLEVHRIRVLIHLITIVIIVVSTIIVAILLVAAGYFDITNVMVDVMIIKLFLRGLE